MDFDDMPDSYFAFLTNQKKVARPERIQTILDEFHTDGEEKSKIRSRVGSASLAGTNLSSQSLPTVPSLPAISSRTTGGGSRPGSSFGQLSGTHQLPTAPAPSLGLSQELRGGSTVVAQNRSGAVVFALVGVLVVAVAVLAVLLLSN
jgi:hypothetical protein